ncbi:MAG: uncharacterized protein A8A55_1247 [Amphiamblys sp. WSBS2006]|nr:MAG: uncharacterized protein A8A55_1247 [Amphiamblys sp. WSBS2006]
MSVEIKLKDSSSVFRLSKEDLVDDHTVLAGILRKEEASLEQFYGVGMLYLKENRTEQCVGIFECGVEYAEEQRTRKDTKTETRILLSLGLYYSGTERGTAIINAVSKTNKKDTLIWLVRGLHYLGMAPHSDPGQAMANIDTALEIEPKNYGARVVKAQILLKTGQYKKSLDLFQECFEQCSFFRDTCAIGIAYCFYFLGAAELAEKCFIRCFERADSIEALYGLIVMDWNKGGENHTELLGIAERNGKADRDIFGLIGDAFPEKEQKYTAVLCGEGCGYGYFLAGKRAQREGDTESALSLYGKSLESSTYGGITDRACLGLVLAHLEKNDGGRVLATLQRVTQQTLSREFFAVVDTYASILQKTPAKRIGELRNAALSNPGNKTVKNILSYAEIGEDREEALRRYREVAAEGGLDSLNNLSVLLALKGCHTEAINLLAAHTDLPAFGAKENITLLHNLTLFFLANGEMERACDTLGRIYEFRAEYSDAVLLHAWTERKRGRVAEAMEIAREGAKTPEIKEQALMFLYSCHVEEKNEGEAKACLEGVLRLGQNGNACAGLGNIFLSEALKEKRGSRRWAGNLKEASSKFVSAVECGDGAVCGLNGLCIILLELGEAQEAKNILLRLREEPDCTADVWLALCEALLCCFSYRMATSICLRGMKVFGSVYEKEFLLSLARLHYVEGKVTSELSAAKEGIAYAEKAHSMCSDRFSLFGLVLCLQSYLSILVSGKQFSPADVEAGRAYGRQAEVFLGELERGDTGSNAHAGLSSEIVSKRRQYTADLLQHLNTLYAREV